MRSSGPTEERGGGEHTAAALEQILSAALLEEAQLRARLAGLIDRRNGLLVEGSDQAVDEVEAELNGVTRRLDRLELRIPMLRIRHAEQLAAEQRAARSVEFDAAVAARISAASQLDEALSRAGAAFRLFRAAERRLARVGIVPGSEVDRDLLAAFRFAAPEFEAQLRIPGAILLRARPLADAELDRWDRVRAGGGPHHAATGRPASARAAPVEAVSHEQLGALGRYGQTIHVWGEESDDVLAA